MALGALVGTACGEAVAGEVVGDDVGTAEG
jgi:hypothetical protein